MSNPPPSNQTFEQSLAELERIVHELEDGQTGLEDALARYEAGVVLLKRCYQQLQVVEQRILLLAGEDPEGKPILETFAHTASADADKPEPRRRKKSDDLF